MYQLAYPVAFHTVDIAIMRLNKGRLQVLLVQKKSEVKEGYTKWRFPGGFVDPTDGSAEEAATREASEETGMTFIKDSIAYIGSSKIDDPRYRESDHKIITSFFVIIPKTGNEGEGNFDDVAHTRWFNLFEISDDTLNPIHQPLYNMLVNKMKYAQFVDEFFSSAINEIKEAVEETIDKVETETKSIFKDVKKAFKGLFE